MEYFMDLVDLAADLAHGVGGVDRVSLFGSRKYPGKVRSDVDLLVSGPASGDVLVDFRESSRQYQPLDLWLEQGGSAFSVVNGSMLAVENLSLIDLFPVADLDRLGGLRRQRFRDDYEYAMSMAPLPRAAVPVRQDNLLVTRRLPSILEDDLSLSAQVVVDVVRNAITAATRMRGDGNAKRGKGSHVTLSVEYDLQNLMELVLASFLPISREPFVVKVSGAKRSADFALADSRIAVELKFAKDGSELSAELKDAHAVLEEYLRHPGVEVALGIIAIAEDVRADVNDIESWTASRGHRVALMRVVQVPRALMHAFGT
ncbi:PD-(D/E)XK nuclease domain-containing protein [Nocardioides kribbensis]|uniref:PD-(D/E)XK nuclease domain-containing protein n=1 Tax=Nocardioides kribbensis TaxID=305517 RepID=UPI00187A1CC0|nr:hypothetical protein [Nocardioides kribbensis]